MELPPHDVRTPEGALHWDLRPPSGERYHELLRAAAERCPLASLTLREDDPGAAAADLGTELGDDLVAIEPREAWPGTRLVGSSAPVAFFETTPRSLEWLLSRVDGLRHWRRTPYEDLAFYRPDGAAWLASSSHEAFASVCLTEEEAGALRRELPWLHLKRL